MINNTMNNIYYVYGHYRKDTNLLFYVGKGKNKRAWDKNSRNKYWHHIVNKVGYEVDIIYKNLTEEQAFKNEIALITDLSPEANFTKGGEGCGFASYGFKGKHHTKERNEALSKKMKGKPNRIITQKDIERFKFYSDKKKKSFIDLSTGIKYEGIRVGARILGIAKSSVIYRIKKGKYKLISD